MKYEIKFACGHTCKIDLFGKKETRDWVAKQKENELCPECYAEERRKDELKMQEKNLKGGMPKLSGSEKQVLWAEEIRSGFADKFDKILEQLKEASSEDPDLAKALIEIVSDMKDEYLGCSNAAWLIAHREDRIERIAGGRYETHDKPVTFIPDELKHSDAIIVDIRDDSKTYFFYQKDDEFRKCLKENKVYWYNGEWWMNSSADKTAQIISQLLELGFAVKVANSEVVDLVKNKEE